MSEQDQNTIVDKLTMKLFWRVGVPIIVIILGGVVLNQLTEKKNASESYVSGHYTELYKLTAELSTTMADIQRTNDEDHEDYEAEHKATALERELMWKRMESIIKRMDKFADHDVVRGVVQTDKKRKYGLEFTSLMLP